MLILIVAFLLTILGVNAIPYRLFSRQENSIYGKNATSYGPQTYGQSTFPAPSNPAEVSADQILFQNLLAAEWIVDSMYTSGLAFFTQSDFTSAGYPNNTYDQLQSVYQNENGHLKLFERAIDSNVVKPGRCNYSYGFEHIANKTEAVRVYMNIVSEVEIGSMAYLTGLAHQAEEVETLYTIMGTISAETRHLTYVNGQVLNVGDFVGPTDTIYPFPLQLLSVTKQFIVPNSCPAENPPYPSPDQDLPKLSIDIKKSKIQSKNGSLTLTADLKDTQSKNDLSVIFFQSVFNYTERATSLGNNIFQVSIPNLTSDKGNLIVALSNTSDVTKKEDIVAGPLEIQLGVPFLG
ncbi:uncharacterized protein FA14DRAFT_175820 [Meira miltonrushii]|uniref:Uncharacterized protein n=1 Tax=Meira miltonrushii TaxID=1280837 RepID=A0A316VHK1_9BASI|nr:uncharacterized protein FA14DRAFT_175820 [Meira miltonrushii]PWN36508.1 hypothetical protein FA14DRAFT_175820 [Meira miltonrushii]